MVAAWRVVSAWARAESAEEVSQSLNCPRREVRFSAVVPLHDAGKVAPRVRISVAAVCNWAAAASHAEA